MQEKENISKFINDAIHFQHASTWQIVFYLFSFEEKR